jgi:hypothetical protein
MIDRRRVHEAASDRGLAGDLAGALERLRATRAAYEAAYYRFQLDTIGDPVGTAERATMDAARDLERALEGSLDLAGRYRKDTRRRMRDSGERSGRRMAARWALMLQAYVDILETCPEAIDRIRATAPDIIEALAGLEKAAREGASTLLIK